MKNVYLDVLFLLDLDVQLALANGISEDLTQQRFEMCLYFWDLASLLLLRELTLD